MREDFQVVKSVFSRVCHVGQRRQQIFVAYSLKFIFMALRRIWECVCKVEKTYFKIFCDFKAKLMVLGG